MLLKEKVFSDLWSMLLLKEGHNWLFWIHNYLFCGCCPITAWIINLIS